MRKKIIVVLAALCLFAGLAMNADAATIGGNKTNNNGTLDCLIATDDVNQM
jgi:hypothetical protein